MLGFHEKHINLEDVQAGRKEDIKKEMDKMYYDLVDSTDEARTMLYNKIRESITKF